jgi:hypothetical protein
MVPEAYNVLQERRAVLSPNTKKVRSTTQKAISGSRELI